MNAPVTRKVEQLQIDISTRVVAEDEQIYVVQPGARYHLYDAFKRHGFVSLDFPDLTLDFARKPDRDDIRAELAKSIAIRDWLDQGRPEPAPSRSRDDHVDAAHGRRLGRYAGAIDSLYYDLKPGTLVLVPGPGYDDEVLFGELRSTASYVSFEDLYGGERVPIRKVRWIARRTRGSLSPELRARLGTPNPILLLDRSLREQIVRAAYDQYVLNGEYASRLKTTENDFSTLDDYNIQTFVNYVAGVLALYEEGRRTGAVSFPDALAALESRRDLVPELALNINSAGFQRLYSATATPLVIAALLTLGTSDPSAGQSLAPPTVVNSAAAKNDACTLEVRERVEGAMALMDADEWKRVCDAVRNAKTHTGLSTSMSVKPRKG